MAHNRHIGSKLIDLLYISNPRALILGIKKIQVELERRGSFKF
jgi:hypothetical protein